MIRTLIADDHEVVRQGVKRIIEDTPDLWVTGEAENEQAVIEQLSTQTWDIVLLDISMPGRGGLEVLQYIKQTHARLPVLMFSMHPVEQYAVRAFKAGAAGYLSKDCIAEELVGAIRKVARGGRYISPSVSEHLALEVTRDSDQPLHQSLSNREFQVLCLFGAGKTATEIAETLCLSVKTISTYRSRILEKMCLNTTAELIRYAIQHQLDD